ncbi:MAG: hypothetical protein LBC61_07700 [Candidatus Peribacteria bacterium]|nr:hypothetical protein [Candidatus Peribacteria bacterium]
MSQEITHACSFKKFIAEDCIAASEVVFIILLIFFTQDSSICLTLSLVIAGVKEFQMLCRVSLTHPNHIQTLLFSTSCSFSHKEDSTSLKCLVIVLFIKTGVAIIFLVKK